MFPFGSWEEMEAQVPGGMQDNETGTHGDRMLQDVTCIAGDSKDSIAEAGRRASE